LFGRAHSRLVPKAHLAPSPKGREMFAEDQQSTGSK